MTYLESTATVSECGKFRYDLTRVWDRSKPRLMWLMYNPSTADGAEDDPTIRRVVGFAAKFGAGGVVVGNLFAYRATLPKDLRRATDPVGPECDSYLRRHAVESRIVVAAWGSLAATGKRPMLRARPPRVRQMLDEIGAKVFHLGLTTAGHPRHPLFLPKDAPLTRWNATPAARVPDRHTGVGTSSPGDA